MPRVRSRPAVSLILSPQEMGAANRLVVAEGEDTEAQHLFVLHEGGSLSQGFHCAQPMSVHDVMAFMRAQKAGARA